MGRPQALAAFVAAKLEIDAILERLREMSDDHFGADPDSVNWGDVGSLRHVLAQLREVRDQLFREGEYAG